eukprot:681423-Rhodomonas_salina.1
MELCEAPGGVELLKMVGYIYAQVRDQILSLLCSTRRPGSALDFARRIKADSPLCSTSCTRTVLESEQSALKRGRGAGGEAVWRALPRTGRILRPNT